MLGATHATGGLLAGAVASTAVASALGIEPNAYNVAVSLVIGSGMAIVADLDTRGTASHSMGAFGLGLTEVLAEISKNFFNATKTKYDVTPPHTDGSHRTFTHLLLFVFLVAGLFYATVHISYALIVWLGVLSTFSISALSPKLRKKTKAYGAVTLLLLCLAGSTYLVLGFPSKFNYEVLSLAALLGLWSHRPYDCTETGIPHPLAPFVKIKGQRWYRIKLPISASSKLANSVISTVSIAATIHVVALYFVPAYADMYSSATQVVLNALQ